jgi:hypothetical protein
MVQVPVPVERRRTPECLCRQHRQELVYGEEKRVSEREWQKQKHVRERQPEQSAQTSPARAVPLYGMSDEVQQIVLDDMQSLYCKTCMNC